MKINFAFFGTDNFSVVVLEKLKKAELLPALIITTPDKPQGRGLVLTPPPVKLWAQQHRIKLLQPEKLDAVPAHQLFVVASYGKIIPKEILEIPEKGALNLHPSLLPRYRGATPIESQILNDEKEIGVTVILMDEQVDHGAILAQRKIETKSRKILAEEGGKLLAETIPRWLAGEIEPKPQDETKATYTKKLTKEDGEINLAENPYQNFLKIRAFEGSIGSYFFAEKPGKKIRVGIKSALYENNTLTITRVVPEGKKEMSYEEFLCGLRIKKSL